MSCLTAKREIWFIGYAGRNPIEFLESLKNNRIELLVDIRRFPKSKVEAFNKDALTELLKRENIAYLWLGDLLGGYRSGGFEEYMKTKDFEKGLNLLIEEAYKRRTCVMCLERKQKYCHRRFIAEALEKRGFKVVEIP
jgi:uncharacterized protein (DUF488 family)